MLREFIFVYLFTSNFALLWVVKYPSIRSKKFIIQSLIFAPSQDPQVGPDISVVLPTVPSAVGGA